MDRVKALKILSDGHSIWKVAYAKSVCEAIGIKFSDKLVEKFYTNHSAKNPKYWLDMNRGEEGTEGVYALTLSCYVATELGVVDKARGCLGRGFQARAYADVIEEELKAKGKEKVESI